MHFFLPYLMDEIQLIAPKMIVTLGNVPLKAVSGDNSMNIGDVHGKPYTLTDGRILFPLYHPAAIIYNRALTQVYQEDLVTLKDFFGTL